MRVRPARSDDSSAVAEMHRQGIKPVTATFSPGVRPAANRLNLTESAEDRYPILVAESDAGEILGWAALSEHSARPNQRGIAECSVYVEADHRGHGVGTALMGALIEEGIRLGCWKLIARAFAANEAGRALCLNAGFREVGILERHSRLDGRWVDVVLAERVIRENQP